ncbi:ankyrin repeat domain-containing protein [Winogradskyella maritima]|uniref:Ankyrin repeat domain-containing protein n=1 Tax=Winogradskyella maritima TaxID=1517766 RepID=A0ABV8AM21_9FLAO|nr:ankyrin repeat domain-containing protein [Winogradskyella maritima]
MNFLHAILLVLVAPSFLFSQGTCSKKLQSSAKMGDLDQLKHLITSKESINCIGEWEQTLLMKAIQNNRNDIAHYLINNGADIFKVDDEGSDALFKTAYYGMVEVAKLLIEKGANVNQKGYLGMTPLMMASNREQLKLMELLLSHSANINSQSNSGYTALMYASNPTTVTYLLNQGIDSSLKNSQGEDALAYFKSELKRFEDYGSEDMKMKTRAIIKIIENRNNKK